MEAYAGVLGIIVMLAVCYLLSSSRRHVPWRVVIGGSILQFVLAIVVLKTAAGRTFFDAMNEMFSAVMSYSQEGARFVFGGLVDGNLPVGTADGPNGTHTPENGRWVRAGSQFAFSVLPTVIFFSALMAVLYHLGIMQRLVACAAWVMRRTLGTSGPESLSAAANIFLGQTEAPLVIKPYLAKMTRSELLAIMTGGMATIAGGVMAAYVVMLSPKFPDIAGHLMAASIMSAPAGLVFAKLLVPETETPDTEKKDAPSPEAVDANTFDAAARGAGEGLTLALNIAAMLIAFIALVALGNALWGLGCHGLERAFGWDLAHIDSLQKLLGYAFWPVAWLLGVPSQDCTVAAQLLGERTILNEFVSYVHMADYLNGQPLPGGEPAHELHERTKVVVSYALCGFANLSSIGILVGGLGALVPERRKDIAKLGLRALLAGTLASFMTAAIAGLLM